MLTKFASHDDPFAEAYAICKEHAVVEGAFPERLQRHWFEASWDLCATHIGLVYPARKIDETVRVHSETGFVPLSYRPSSPVALYAGVKLIGNFPPNSPCFTGEGGCPEICAYCACYVRAIYQVGSNASGLNSARFVQAVARVFTYLAENRGEVPMDEGILGTSGALAFLSAETTYAL